MNPSQKSVPFSLFIEVALRDREFIELEGRNATVYAKLLELIDTDNQFCFIQYPEDWPSIQWPRLWSIKAWRSASERYYALRELEARRRKHDITQGEIFNEIKEKISELTGLEIEDKTSNAFLTQVAYKILNDRNELLANQFGIDLKTIPEPPEQRRI